MKKITFFLLILTMGCTDLNIKPNDTLLENVVFTEETAYTSYLAKIYGALILTGQQGPAGSGDLSIINDEGFGSYIRTYWQAQELTTDEAVIRWEDSGIQDLNTLKWSSDNQFIRVLYYRIYYLISLCNDFLRVSTGDVLSENGINTASQLKINVYRKEVRFVRALGYWHLLDLYRNIPLITSVSAELPVQKSPTEIFNFIVTELNQIETSLVEPRKNEYGRVDKAGLWMLRGKLLLNHEIYLQQPDPKLYEQVIKDMTQIINAGYTLQPNYLDLFKADNHLSQEIIFSLNSDGDYSRTWGGTTFLVSAMIFSGMGKQVDGSEDFTQMYGVNGGWLGIRAPRNFVELFEDANGNLIQEDKRMIFFTKGRNKSIEDILGQDDGYAVPKFINVTSKGAMGKDQVHPDTDFPMFRLADVYLMYAEAVLRGATNGNKTQALTYINNLRQRAYGDDKGNITETELTLDFLLDERGRELYYEGHRRVDLIRFNTFSVRGGAQEKLWQWKGNDVNGKSVEEHLEIFPLPSSDLNSNPNLRQNPGY